MLGIRVSTRETGPGSACWRAIASRLAHLPALVAWTLAGSTCSALVALLAFISCLADRLFERESRACTTRWPVQS